MAEYIDREKFLKRLGEEYPGIPPHGAIVVGMLCDEEPADVVSWAYLERYASWFCADVSFPEFIREAKAFLKASGGFQEGSQIYD